MCVTVKWIIALVFVQWSILYVECQTMLHHGMKVAIKSDNGLYLARCKGCVYNNPYEFGFIYQTRSTLNDSGTWTVSTASTSTVYLMTQDGLYLSLCYFCSSNSNANFTVISGYPGSQAEWTPIYSGNQVAFRNKDSGRYLQRCEGCSYGALYQYPHQATVDGTDRDLWTVEQMGVRNSSNNPLQNLIWDLTITNPDRRCLPPPLDFLGNPVEMARVDLTTIETITRTLARDWNGTPYCLSSSASSASFIRIPFLVSCALVFAFWNVI
jgi:hypothetical protein